MATAMEAPGAGDTSTLGAWFTLYREGDPGMFRYLLFMRYVVVNIIAIALAAVLWLNGYADMVLQGDTTQFVLVIALVFFVGLIYSGALVGKLSNELNAVRAPVAGTRAFAYCALIEGRDGESRQIAAASLRLKLAGRISIVRHMAGSLVFLGLIGTVIGFMIALSGVNPEKAADIGAIGPMVSTLIGGMSVALSTTLVGAVLNIWLMINYRILESGALRLYTAIVEQGERNVRL